MDIIYLKVVLVDKGKEQFHTARGYELMEKDSCLLTPSMEDYLEMAYRLSLDRAYTRISDLASALNVQPPSASNMLKKLSDLSLVQYEKYALVILTDKGLKLGKYLFERHEIIAEFLRFIGTGDILVETEKIEHNISPQTIEGLKVLLDFFSTNPDSRKAFKAMQQHQI